MITAVGVVDPRVPPPEDGCEDLVDGAHRLLCARRALAATDCARLVAEARTCYQDLHERLTDQWWATATPAGARACYAAVRAWDRICPDMAVFADHLEVKAELHFGICLDREWDRAMVSADLPWYCPPAAAVVHLGHRVLAEV